MKKIIIYILLISSLFLCSCQGSFADGFYRILGIDNTDYSAEAAIAVLDLSDETAEKLAKASTIICFGDNIETFESFSEKADKYIDITLNYLAGSYYSRYSADKVMMEKFSENYPELNMNALIPLADYENTVYTYFGGGRKAVVKSTAMYSYLDRINAFVLVGQTPDYDIEYTLHYAEETENTYRLTVSYTRSNVQAGTYDIVFRKRDGGDPYIWRLSVSSKVYSGS